MRYSQNNEQDVIGKYFLEPGVFLDIGANDGVTLSNTYSLQLAGWRGVLIEPSESAFQKIPYNELVIAFRVAIGTNDGNCDFYEMGEHLNRGDSSLLSTIKRSEMNRWRRVNFQKKTVEVWTYKKLVEKSPYKSFDFISIDAEGMDFEILQQINLAQTRMVCIEHNGDRALFQSIKDYCEKSGLKSMLLNNSENVIWAR